MADISGTNLAAQICPFTTSDAYNTHDSKYGKGGWREVATTAERDAITTQRRTAGMAVYVTSESKVYILGSDLVTWTEFETGKIDKIQKNGTDLPITNKTVNVEVPVKISDLTDDTSTNPIDKADTLTGLTATATELNYCDGVTSNIQTQLDGKQASGNYAITDGANTFLGAQRIETNSTNGLVIKSTTAGGYLAVTRGSSNPVTMAIKAGTSGGTFGTTTNHPFQFRTNDTSRMVIGTDGSVKLEQDVDVNSNDKQVATTKWINDKDYQNATQVNTAVTSYHDSTKYDASNPNGYTSNTGTVTSVAVKMNGSTKGTVTTSGVIDLGTVITSHQDISGKENTSNKVTSISSASTNTQYPSAKCVYDIVGNIEATLQAIRGV